MTTDVAGIDPVLAQTWLRRWDTQQERYIADRETRFTVISDVITHATQTTTTPLIVDLGCGPGSLSARMAEHLPTAEIVGVDMDPLLLALARAAYPDAARYVEANLGSPGWSDALGVDRPIDAAMSTTALHWMPEEWLAAMYVELAAKMRPGGVFVNGDHLYDDQPGIAAIAETVSRRGAERAGVLDNEEWGPWWQEIGREPALADLVAKREHHINRGHQGNDLSVRGHAELLKSAGFSEVGPVWQSGDDVLLVALR